MFPEKEKGFGVRGWSRLTRVLLVLVCAGLGATAGIGGASPVGVLSPEALELSPAPSFSSSSS